MFCFNKTVLASEILQPTPSPDTLHTPPQKRPASTICSPHFHLYSFSHPQPAFSLFNPFSLFLASLSPVPKGAAGRPEMKSAFKIPSWLSAPQLTGVDGTLSYVAHPSLRKTPFKKERGGNSCQLVATVEWGEEEIERICR